MSVRRVIEVIDRWKSALGTHMHIESCIYWDGGSDRARLYHHDEHETALEEMAKESSDCLETLQKLLVEEDASKSLRVQFLGSESEKISRNGRVVVSFPGVHGLAWTFLTTLPTAMPTSCVFLPDRSAKGYGEHAFVWKHPLKHCHCMELYESEQSFGCMWFQIWMKKTHEAYHRGGLVVVTKSDGTLGNSQAGEVRFLQDCAYKYSTMTINEFAAQLLSGLQDPHNGNNWTYDGDEDLWRILTEVRGVLEPLID